MEKYVSVRAGEYTRNILDELNHTLEQRPDWAVELAERADIKRIQDEIDELRSAFSNNQKKLVDELLSSHKNIESIISENYDALRASTNESAFSIKADLHTTMEILREQKSTINKLLETTTEALYIATESQRTLGHLSESFANVTSQLAEVSAGIAVLRRPFLKRLLG